MAQSAAMIRDAETFQSMAEKVRQIRGSFQSETGQKLGLVIDNNLRALEYLLIEFGDGLREKAKQ